jgi:Big-like domain-containing protein/type IX secretion system substrate protein
MLPMLRKQLPESPLLQTGTTVQWSRTCEQTKSALLMNRIGKNFLSLLFFAGLLFLSKTSFALPPSVFFNGGSPQSLSVCQNSGATDINYLLTASGTGATFTWTLTSSPANGTISSSVATAAGGANITPTGFTYTPGAGYTGPDAFTFQVSDGTTTATTTINVTVNPQPDPVTGPAAICNGLGAAYTDGTAFGEWTSSNTSVATIGTGSGDVTGVSAGTATISYTVLGGCYSVGTLVVNPLPNAISGNQVCIGSMATLTDAGGGTWLSSNTSVATVDMGTGAITGVTLGTSTITYTLPTTCVITGMVTVNPLPVIGAGSNVVICNMDNTTLNASGADTYTWAPADGLSCTNCPSPVASPSITTTYTVTGTVTATGCNNTAMVTVSVNPLPSAISGDNVCLGSTTTLSDAGGGTWTINNTSVATIDMSSGVLTGVSVATANVTYTLPTTCWISEVITVNPLPDAITGSAVVCAGLTTNALSDPDAGGAWSSDNTAEATVDALTGTVTGVSAGTPDILFTFTATGCSVSTQATVNPLPAAIIGNSVCFGLSTTLSDATGTGSWSNDNTAVATIDPATGLVSSVAVGTTTVTYTLPTGCIMSSLFIVNPIPAAITGATTVCPAMTIALSDAGGGSWNSGNTSVATVDAGTGIVTGVATGSANITYTLPTSCIISASVNVLPQPKAFTVTGGGSYCAGDTGVYVRLSGSDTGFHYQLSYGRTPVDTLAGTDSALNFGLYTAAGNYTVISRNDTTGCTTTMTSHANISINQLPHLHNVTGGGTFCSGGIGEPVGLDGSYSRIAYKLYDGGTFVDSLTGTGAALDFGLRTAGGTYKVVATNRFTGCTRNMSDSAVIIVNPLITPSVSFYSHDIDTTCLGSSVTFTATPVLGGHAPDYQWSVNSIAVGTDTATYSYVPVNGDVVAVVMKSDTACLTTDLASNEVTMVVDTVYIPSITISGYSGLVTSKGQSITLTAAVSNGGTNPKYQWIKNGVVIAGATNATYTSVTFANKDSVTCLVLGSAKCGLPTFNSVIMQITTVGVTEIAHGMEVNVIPNPNNGTFTVKGSLGISTEDGVSLEVTNMLGQSVYKSSVMVRDGSINAEVNLGNSIASGMYLLSVISGNEHQVFHIVVKQ